jgi:hypothetical protein
MSEANAGRPFAVVKIWISLHSSGDDATMLGRPVERPQSKAPGESPGPLVP